MLKINTLKKLILIVIASISLISCRKDDDKSEVTILGTWKIDKHIARYGNGSTVTETLDECQTKTNFTFSSDGTLNAIAYFKGGEQSTNCQISNSKGTYVYNENNMTIKFNFEGDNTSTAKVESLTSNQLILMIIDEDFDGDGTSDQLVRVFKK